MTERAEITYRRHFGSPSWRSSLEGGLTSDDITILALAHRIYDGLSRFEVAQKDAERAMGNFNSLMGEALLKNDCYSAWAQARTDFGVEAKFDAAHDMLASILPLEDLLVATPPRTRQSIELKVATLTRLREAYRI